MFYTLGYYHISAHKKNLIKMLFLDIKTKSKTVASYSIRTRRMLAELMETGMTDWLL